MPTKLYSPAQIGVASFLGTPLTAAWLLSRNAQALGDRQQAASLLLRGTFATAAVFGVASFLPIRPPSLLWPLIYSTAVAFYARRLSADRCQNAAAHTERRRSWWSAIAIALGALMLLLMLLYALAWILGHKGGSVD